MKRLFHLFYFLLAVSPLCLSQRIIIDSIIYEGNAKTKNYILRRELDFKLHDSLNINQLKDRFKENRSRILNTGLFKEVVINVKSWNTETNHTTILIKVEEAWYIYPIPIFELADRNFNVWWNEFNGSFKRVNYGIRFIHNNLTGNQDALKVAVQLGYSSRLDAQYAWPYWGKNRNWRFTTDLLLSKNKESYYTTFEDKPVFYKSSNDYPLRRTRIGTSLENRTSLQLFQKIKLEYNYNQTISEISENLNPDFFLNGYANQKYFSLNYTFAYDDRDLKYFPTKGRKSEIQITKEGLGNTNGSLNTLFVNLHVEQFFPWTARHSAGFLINAKASIIRNQVPYYNSKALGYGNEYLKGFEYYVVDGIDYLFLKFRESYIFYEDNFKFRPQKKLGIKSMPLRLGIAAHAGTAYVNNIYYASNNNLANRWIYSSGLSLECLLSNTSLIQLDWSINGFKEAGFYLHFRDQF
ncbi:MAG: BamA/TamA family outer membrane protein [Saprospiraceae bacterium]